MVLFMLGRDEREVDVRLLHLLGPFHGVIGRRFRTEGHATGGGRTLAVAILGAGAYGPGTASSSCERESP